MRRTWCLILHLWQDWEILGQLFPLGVSWIDADEFNGNQSVQCPKTSKKTPTSKTDTVPTWTVSNSITECLSLNMPQQRSPHPSGLYQSLQPRWATHRGDSLSKDFQWTGATYLWPWLIPLGFSWFFYDKNPEMPGKQVWCRDMEEFFMRIWFPDSGLGETSGFENAQYMHRHVGKITCEGGWRGWLRTPKKMSLTSCCGVNILLSYPDFGMPPNSWVTQWWHCGPWEANIYHDHSTNTLASPSPEIKANNKGGSLAVCPLTGPY